MTNCNYVFNKLLKEYNRQYFTNYTKTNLFSIKEDVKSGELIALLNVGDTFINDEIFEIIEDLYELKCYSGTPTCISKLGKQLQTELKELSSVVSAGLSFPSTEIKEELENILVKLSENSCAVGGCVRDTLLEKTPKDFDYVTDADYDVMSSTFTSRGWTVKETGKQFRVMIVNKDGQDFEIANFRKDNTYTDGRRPESTNIGTIQDDAQRRDFTINALYFSLGSKTLIDPTGQGITDVKNKTLRFIGSAEDRIKQDYLRVFRFYRFMSTKGLTAHPGSLRTVRTMFAEAVSKTDPERIRVEIERM